MKRFAILLLAACGGPSKPAPAPIANTPSPPAPAKTVDCAKLLDKVAPIFMEGKTLTADERAKAVADCQNDVAKNPNDPVMLCMMDAVGKTAIMDCVKLADVEHHKARKTEAELQLNKIGKNAKIFFITNAEYVKGTAKQLPDAPCCLGPNNKCPVTDLWTKDPVWSNLDFEIDEPNQFQYSYTSDGKTFHAEAVGDLDCDGIMITYKLDGEAPNGNPAARLTPPPPNSD